MGREKQGIWLPRDLGRSSLRLATPGPPLEVRIPPTPVSHEILMSLSDPFESPVESAPAAPVPTPELAIVFVASLALAFAGVGGLLHRGLGEAGLLLAEWGLLLIPSLLFVRLGGFDPIAVFSLRRPSARHVGGSVLMIAGCLPVAWFIAWVQSFAFPTPPALVEGLEALVTAETRGRFVWLLLVLGVTPAICEEALFRGVLLGSTRTLAPWRMILLNGLVFGVFHLSLDTFLRFLPTAWLGIVIAWTVWRTGSIFIGVLMHFLNNGIIVLLASTPGVRGLAGDPGAAPPLWLAPTALALIWVGARVLSRPRRLSMNPHIGNQGP